VPLSALVTPAETKALSVTGDNDMSPATGAKVPVTPADVIDDVIGDVTPVTAALAGAVEALRGQLEIANGRAERAELRIEELQRRIDGLHSDLADMISGSEAAALRTQADERRTWHLLRRLRWALRGE